MNALIRKSLCFILALAFFTVQTARAQQTTPTAPVPPQIQQAQTVFLSNAGADSFFVAFSGGSDRGYNNLYSAIKNWGKYRIVNTPGQADLILEIKSLAPATVGANTTPVYDPQIRLQLMDPGTRAVLWTLTSYIHAGIGTQSVRDKQFDQAATGLFDQLRQLTGETLTPAQSKVAHSKPGSSRGTKIFFISLVAAGLLTTGLLAYHFSHRSPPTLAQPAFPACTTPFCPVP